MKNYQSTSNQQLLIRFLLVAIVCFTSILFTGFTNSNNLSNIYDSSEIYDVKNMSYEELGKLKSEVIDFLDQRKRTTNASKLEVLNWEIFRRGYKHHLPKHIQRYIQQQIELKMIRDGKVEGEMEDEIIENPYTN